MKLRKREERKSGQMQCYVTIEKVAGGDCVFTHWRRKQVGRKISIYEVTEFLGSTLSQKLCQVKSYEDVSDRIKLLQVKYCRDRLSSAPFGTKTGVTQAEREKSVQEAKIA